MQTGQHPNTKIQIVNCWLVSEWKLMYFWNLEVKNFTVKNGSSTPCPSENVKSENSSPIVPAVGMLGLTSNGLTGSARVVRPVIQSVSRWMFPLTHTIVWPWRQQQQPYDGWSIGRWLVNDCLFVSTTFLVWTVIFVCFVHLLWEYKTVSIVISYDDVSMSVGVAWLWIVSVCRIVMCVSVYLSEEGDKIL